MSFDPTTLRRQLGGLMIDHYRRISFAEAKEKASLNGTGWGMLGCGVECLLVGFFDVGRELLQKTNTFLQASIDLNERAFLGEGERFADLALCKWLLEGSHDLSNLRAAVAWKERWYAERAKASKMDVQLALPLYLDAEEYETLILRYETTGLNMPASLRRIQGEGTMGYVMARHRLGLGFSSEEIEAALNTFLKRRVPQWLGGEGRYDDCARWMKIAFWKKGDDPVATLLRCYDYLPGLKAPKYPENK